jgi:FkbM family methyltransferase
MDVWSIKETFIDKFYERFGTVIGDQWRIIDIGAGIGEFTIFAAAGSPNNLVYAFEPYPDSFTLLQKNVEANKITNVEMFPQAISDKTGTMALDISGGEPLQIKSESVGTTHSQANQIEVPSLSLAEAIEQLKLDKCELVKLDCEGAEYPILLNTPRSVLDKIDRIIMEYHDVGSFTHHDLVEHLSRHGFTVRTYSNPVHDYLGYLSALR